MTAHRQHYMELHAPQPEAVDGYSIGGWIVCGIVFFILCLAGLASLVRATLQHPDGRQRTSLTLPHLQAVDEARIQGFRAGYERATEEGCQPALSSPLAPQ